jgi:hypothetical protein
MELVRRRVKKNYKRVLVMSCNRKGIIAWRTPQPEIKIFIHLKRKVWND